jgi:hypothetical protein
MDTLVAVSGNEIQYRDRNFSPTDIHEICRLFPVLEKSIAASLMRACAQEGVELPEDQSVEIVWNALLESNKRAVLQKAERIVASLLRTEVVKSTMKKMGYTVHTGGMWAWDGDSTIATEQTALLGKEFGVPVGAHQSDPRKKVEDELIHIREMRAKPHEFDQKKYHDRVRSPWYDQDGYGGKVLNIELLQDASPAQRRMMYQMGVV